MRTSSCVSSGSLEVPVSGTIPSKQGRIRARAHEAERRARGAPASLLLRSEQHGSIVLTRSKNPRRPRRGTEKARMRRRSAPRASYG